MWFGFGAGAPPAVMSAPRMARRSRGAAGLELMCWSFPAARAEDMEPLLEPVLALDPELKVELDLLLPLQALRLFELISAIVLLA